MEDKIGGPLLRQDVLAANEEGRSFLVYEGYATDIGEEQIREAAVKLSAMPRLYRRHIMSDVQANLDKFVSRYPMSEIDVTAIPAKELADFRADVTILFADKFRRGELEQYRMPESAFAMN